MDMLKKLEWESGFFHTECAQFYPRHKSGEYYDDAAFNAYDWVQGKCYITDEVSKSIFGEYKFVFEDTRVIFGKEIEKKPVVMKEERFSIDISTPDDIDVLQRIAIEGLVEHSRLPVLVGEAETGRFYAKWVEKAVYGSFDDICFSLKAERSPIGFITLKYSENGNAKIGLISIQRGHQGKKLGKALIQHAENFLYGKNYRHLSVITEGRNIQAQQFYIKYGFNIDNIECWYYRRRFK
ncbi:GNAT family N-acetyltransferase [Hydrogenimonas cancrithermarum]|uniref:N-acetyltransferase domain-containing protein n=1 Tax=Hydrogenimonas cancrithermarum TaxID=2993563 RepID=A0ABN6WXV5_9BACT|nr:GNAT family N-acetyltransferase [Hydrogenimonas cancrithermarum]BDY13576.1 hypothetical protein HCR_18880 [Hydrogenimonas cancrithermarum]